MTNRTPNRAPYLKKLEPNFEEPGLKEVDLGMAAAWVDAMELLSGLRTVGRPGGGILGGYR